MDPRIREHAEILADHSTDMGEDDDVVIQMSPEAEDLAVALHEVAGERGANPIWLTYSDRADRAFMRARDAADVEFTTPEHHLSFYEDADVFIVARGGANATEKSDVDPDTTAAHRRAMKPILNERLSKRWNLTQFPTPAHAQLAGMSTEAYENFVWDAINKDWDAQHDFQESMVDIVNEGEEVRIVSGEETDLTMSVGGNTTINDWGKHNMPAGEVFTAPVKDSVEGTVYFDLPLYRHGREIEGVRLRFEEGRVEDYSAERNEETLAGILDTDEGSRYLGELGIGMNRAIDQFTYNMLFDEKMGDTVHMAVGRAYDETVGAENEANESAEHVDMIVDMSEDSRIEVDGEVVQRDGTFAFEDGFDG